MSGKFHMGNYANRGFDEIITDMKPIGDVGIAIKKPTRFWKILLSLLWPTMAGLSPTVKPD